MMESSKAPKQQISISPVAHTKMILHAIRHANSSIHGILIGTIVDNDTTGDDTTSATGSTGARLEISNALPVFHSTPTKPLLEMALRLAQSYCSSSTSSSTSTSSSKQRIVGWYTANERNNETTPNQAALKIMSGIASQWSLHQELDLNVSNKNDKGNGDGNGFECEPVLGFISFHGLSSLLTTSCGTSNKEGGEGKENDDDGTVGGLQWYGSDSKHSWLESYPCSNISSTSPSNNNTTTTTELIQQAISASLDSNSNTKDRQDVLDIYDFEDHLEGNDALLNDWIGNERVAKFVQEYIK